MKEQLVRTEMIFGTASMERLAAARVAVFGVGGVGGYAVEALARSGVGALDLIDHDTVALSNLNRQIIATHETVGKRKVEVARERVLSIHPTCEVRTSATFVLPETVKEYDFSSYDYVIDAIDTVAGKLALIEAGKEAGTPVISAMGAGNKTDPSAFRVADIYETKVCPLAKVMRKECKKRGIEHLKVVYSEEEPRTPFFGVLEEDKESDRRVPGSTAFCPSVAGLIMAGEVVRDIAEGFSVR